MSNKNNTQKKNGGVKYRFSLSIVLALIVFVILLLTLAVSAALTWLMANKSPIISIKVESLPDIWSALWFISIVSLVVGTIITTFAGKIPLRPINTLISRMNRLSSGDFSTRLHFGKPIRIHPAFIEMEDSFNTMAEELENTEMLRSEFINNFSHEFKTPIVSIAGFAKLLKRGDLTESQKNEYIDAIEEESQRLAHMATNVLNLTKIENQTILTNLSKFNVSEQIRSSVLLLEPLWTRKDLDLAIDFSEYEIEANEELLKQVWINLIENAIKFSQDGGPLEIKVGEGGGNIAVSISNAGEIPASAVDKIWNKFYQADESHASAGNGVGLAIVKRVAELHGGSARVSQSDGTVTFTVTLPKKHKAK